MRAKDELDQTVRIPIVVQPNLNPHLPMDVMASPSLASQEWEFQLPSPHLWDNRASSRSIAALQTPNSSEVIDVGQDTHSCSRTIGVEGNVALDETPSNNSGALLTPDVRPVGKTDSHH
jgi:hypothetical protein